MALQPQYLEIPLLKGVDTKTDSRQTPIGKLLNAENVEFLKAGRINKRNGYVGLPRTKIGGGLITSGQAIANYQEELIAFDETTAYSFVDGTDKWNDKGNFVSAYLTGKNVTNSTNRDYANDSAIHPNGVECYVFVRQDANGDDALYYTVLDTTTGQTVVAPTLVANEFALAPKVVAFKNTFCIFYYDSDATQIFRGVLPLGSLKSTITFSPITADSADENGLDLSVPAFYVYTMTTATGGEKLYMIFNNRETPTKATIRMYSSPQGNATAQTTLTEGARYLTIFKDDYYDAPVFVSGEDGPIYVRIFDPLILDANDDQVIVWWSQIYNEEQTGFFPELPVLLTGVSKSSTQLDLDIYFTTYSFAPYTRRVNLTNASVGGIGPFGLSNHNQAFNINQYNPNNEYAYDKTFTSIAGSAFAYGGRSYLPVVSGYSADTSIVSFYLTDEDAQTFGKWADEKAGGAYFQFATTPYYFWTPKTNRISESEWDLSLIEKNNFGQINGKDITGVSSIRFDFFEPIKSYSNAQISDNLMLGSGILYQYDGVSFVENGFNYKPEIIQITATSGSGTGSYQYAAVYEWIDQQGNLTRSPPSEVKTRLVAQPIGVSGSTTQLNILPLVLTQKTNEDGRSPVIVAVYRTELNGELFYRLPITNANINKATGPQATVQMLITDNTTDSALIDGVPLYTDGGELEADQAPAVGAMTVHRNRLFVLDSVNPLVIYPSKEVSVGVPVEFNKAQRINIDPTGGPVTGLASLDDKLIIFKETSIRYISGQGPDNNGENGDFGDSILITTDAGCVNTRSIVVTPEGLFFKSKKGIYMLGRGLQVSYIGAPVEDWNQYEITSAVLLEDRNQVRFTLENDKCLVYDYFVGAWSIFTNLSAQDSVIWQDKHTLIRSNGLAMKQTDGVFKDDNSNIHLKITTTWLNFAGIQGFQRWWKCYLLGKWLSPHRLSVKIAYDYNDAYEQEITVNPTTPPLYGEDVYGYPSGSVYGGNYDIYQYQINPARQKCMSSRITFRDLPDVSGSFGAGLEISNLRLEYGIQKKGNRLPDTKLAG